MNNKKHFIGIDVAKDTLEIVINKEAEQQDHLMVSNDLKGMKAFEMEGRLTKRALLPGIQRHLNYTLVDFLSRKH
ncbi:MAG: hypothetical protein AAF392_00155 [Bacteroidota bacterium]